MRVIAVTSEESAQGHLTEADEVVGRVSTDGTIFLVVFVGVFAGTIGAIAFALLRSVLPRSGAVAGLLIAGIIGGILARPSDLINPDSIDFRILGPKWLAALMVLALVALLGATSGVLIDTFVRRWPEPAWTARGIASVLPLIVIAIPSPLVLGVIAVLGVRGWGKPEAGLGTVARSFAVMLVVVGAAGWLWTLAAAAEIVF